MLLLAKQVQDGADTSGAVTPRLKILHSDMVHITAQQVKLTSKDWTDSSAGTEAFGTDAEIGARAKG